MLDGKNLGFCVTGSFHNIPRVLPQIERLRNEGASVTPVLSTQVASLDTRFYRAAELQIAIEALTGVKPLTTLTEVEPLGPKKAFDAVVVAPCTGNTLAKIANGITDGPVVMAVKSHLRNGRPVVLSVSSNDLLGINARNLGVLLATKNVYFVPFGQDNPFEKPSSLDSDPSLILDSVVAALQGRQIQPILIPRHNK